jgi:hypothetical protein
MLLERIRFLNEKASSLSFIKRGLGFVFYVRQGDQAFKKAVKYLDKYSSKCENARFLWWSQ